MNRIFLLGGQSNMVGAGIAAQLPDSLRTAPANVSLFEENEYSDLFWRDKFGPEVGFAHSISGTFANDRVILCKVAKSGANLYYDWNPDGTSRGPEDDYRGPLYPRMVAAMSTISEECASTGEPYEITGALWMQGERDSVFEFMANAYEENLLNLIEALRRDTHNHKLPFVLAQIAPRSLGADSRALQHAFRGIVQAAQRRVALARDLVGLVETEDLPQHDDLHFDTDGQLELGRRFAEVFLMGSANGSHDDQPGADF